MDKIGKIINKIVPNIVLILSLVILAFMILDWFNPLMNFLENTISRVLIIMLCIVSVVNSALFIKYLIKKNEF